MAWPRLLARIRLLGAWFHRSLLAIRIASIAEILGKLTVVVGIFDFVIEAPDRAKQRHYQAWQLLNVAREAHGDAGRRIALRDLIKDHVSLTELSLAGGNFDGMDFRSMIAPGLDLTGAKIGDADFSCKSGIFLNDYWRPSYSSCWTTDLSGARIETEIVGVNFFHADLRGTVLGSKPNDDQRARRTIAAFHNNNLEKRQDGPCLD